MSNDERTRVKKLERKSTEISKHWLKLAWIHFKPNGDKLVIKWSILYRNIILLNIALGSDVSVSNSSFIYLFVLKKSSSDSILFIYEKKCRRKIKSKQNSKDIFLLKFLTWCANISNLILSCLHAIAHNFNH